MAVGSGSNRLVLHGGGTLMLGGQRIGKIEDVSLSVSYTTNTLRSGTEQFPWISLSAGAEVTGTARSATLDLASQAAIQGTSIATSGVIWVANEEITIDATGGNTLSNVPVLPDSETIFYTTESTEQMFLPAASAADGEYTLTDVTGAIAWNASETHDGLVVKANYGYYANTGRYIETLGTTAPPTVRMVLAAEAKNLKSGVLENVVFTANAVQLSSINHNISNEGYGMTDISFNIVQDGNGVVYRIHQEQT